MFDALPDTYYDIAMTFDGEDEAFGILSKRDVFERLNDFIIESDVTALTIIEVPFDVKRQDVTEDMLRAWLAWRCENEQSPDHVPDIELAGVKLRWVAEALEAGAAQSAVEWAAHVRSESDVRRFV